MHFASTNRVETLQDTKLNHVHYTFYLIHNMSFQRMVRSNKAMYGKKI
uniref:Uncharacterized protein n=1 Tax=Lepeophtheirus salmonis TaxID=72036 RepID=A0A0K2TMQ1_LEPSM